MNVHDWYVKHMPPLQKSTIEDSYSHVVDILDIVLYLCVLCIKTSPATLSPLKLVVEGYKERKPSDQTHPVAKLPSELVVKRLHVPCAQGLRPPKGSLTPDRAL